MLQCLYRQGYKLCYTLDLTTLIHAGLFLNGQCVNRWRSVSQDTALICGDLSLKTLL